MDLHRIEPHVISCDLYHDLRHATGSMPSNIPLHRAPQLLLDVWGDPHRTLRCLDGRVASLQVVTSLDLRCTTWYNSTQKLDDEWPESIFHHVGSQSASYLLSVRCEVLRRFPASSLRARAPSSVLPGSR